VHSLALLLDDPIYIRVRPTPGDHLGPRKLPRLGNPVSGSSGSIVIVTRCTGATGTARKFLGNFFHRAFDELRLCRHGLVYPFEGRLYHISAPFAFLRDTNHFLNQAGQLPERVSARCPVNHTAGIASIVGQTTIRSNIVGTSGVP
jgi:hypothetical protein